MDCFKLHMLLRKCLGDEKKLRLRPNEDSYFNCFSGPDEAAAGARSKPSSSCNQATGRAGCCCGCRQQQQRSVAMDHGVGVMGACCPGRCSRGSGSPGSGRCHQSPIGGNDDCNAAAAAAAGSRSIEYPIRVPRSADGEELYMPRQRSTAAAAERRREDDEVYRVGVRGPPNKTVYDSAVLEGGPHSSSRLADTFRGQRRQQQHDDDGSSHQQRSHNARVSSAAGSRKGSGISSASLGRAAMPGPKSAGSDGSDRRAAT